MQNKNYTTISIPNKLFKRIKKDIKETGFNSVSSFATFVLREISLSKSWKKKGVFNMKEVKNIKEKLRELGYLE